MTELRDDFEHRLGQGLKRWAEAGEPSLDLEAAVTGRRRQQRSRLIRWATSLTVAAALLASLAATFPRWAVAAAGWPVVGRVMKEIILKDAGLKWAYESGLMQGTLAEQTQGDITVRIVGAVATSSRTTVLFQVVGLKAAPVLDPRWDPQNRKTMADERPAFLDMKPLVRVKEAPVAGDFFSNFNGLQPPVNTPLGLFGTLNTAPLKPEGGTMVIEAEFDGKLFTLSFPISRSASDRLTTEIPVHQTQEIDGIRYTVESVIQTPVETLVRYSVERDQPFQGWYGVSDSQTKLRFDGPGTLEVVQETQPDGDDLLAVFPRVDLPNRLTLPADVKGKPVALVWPLEKGAVQQTAENPITLTDWHVDKGDLLVEFTLQPTDQAGPPAEFELLDADGHSYRPIGKGSSWSGQPGKPQRMAVRFGIPAGVTPVAIRADQIGVVVRGPWTFELPAK